jgi:mRNA interferase RelE/StbE
VAARYRVEIAPAAQRELSKLPKNVKKRIDERILALAENPRPPGSKKLEGADDFHRIRVGDYRIVYQIKDKVLLVLVVRIGHRREVYRSR